MSLSEEIGDTITYLCKENLCNYKKYRLLFIYEKKTFFVVYAIIK